MLFSSSFCNFLQFLIMLSRPPASFMSHFLSTAQRASYIIFPLFGKLSFSPCSPVILMAPPPGPQWFSFPCRIFGRYWSLFLGNLRICPHFWFLRCACRRILFSLNVALDTTFCVCRAECKHGFIYRTAASYGILRGERSSSLQGLRN